MKRISALLCLLLCAMGGVWAQNGKPFVIPELKEWKGGRGFFVPDTSLRVVYDDLVLQTVAEAFAADYQTLFGIMPEVVRGKAETGDFFLTLKNDEKLGGEGYEIEVDRCVKISAPKAVGAY